jgi:hypothetical protein
MREFTLSAYKSILETFRENDYVFLRFEDFLTKTENRKLVILRHDVDRFPKNTLRMAQMEFESGIRSTYFFRTIPSVYKPDIMKAVAAMGHEVAYHYEDLTKTGGNCEKAIARFAENLEKIRTIYPARTICMHGSPLSKWDNKEMWLQDSSLEPHASRFTPHYHDFGIIGDTSFDVNYEEVFYITDNGWGWNNTASSVRDKVVSRFDIPINNTEHFLQLIRNGSLPEKILFNTHPDSFFEAPMPWLLNKMFIRSKNLIKRQVVKYKLIK